RIPQSTRPANEPSLPILQKSWELWPRLFVQVLDEPSRSAGRPVFLDFRTPQGTIGMPADAQRVITVAAADLAGHLQGFSASGPAPRLELLAKPEIRTQDGLRVVPPGTPAAFGTSLASAYAAGVAASVLSTGT